MRKLITKIAALIMHHNGFRFSKDYRHGISLKHRLVYYCIDTVAANLKAEGY